MAKKRKQKNQDWDDWEDAPDDTNKPWAQADPLPF